MSKGAQPGHNSVDNHHEVV